METRRVTPLIEETLPTYEQLALDNSRLRGDLLDYGSKLIKIRTTAERNLIRQIDTLENALHALHHNREAVTDEFIRLCLTQMKIDLESVNIKNWSNN